MRASAPLLTGVATQALSVWLRKVGMGRYALPDLRQAGSRSLDLSVQSTSGSYGSGGRSLCLVSTATWWPSWALLQLQHSKSSRTFIPERYGPIEALGSHFTAVSRQVTPNVPQTILAGGSLPSHGQLRTPYHIRSGLQHTLGPSDPTKPCECAFS